MARPDRSAEIDRALLAHLEAHPRDLVRVVAEKLSLSRAAVGARVRVLVERGLLQKEGSTRPTYGFGSSRRVVLEYQLADLQEDRVWSQDVLPVLGQLPRNVLDICHHGITEMVNNAIDHSEGTVVVVEVILTPDGVALTISDDGIGIFRKITKALALPDERLSLLELSKGKLTTDPRRHSGEGVFFTSRMFDHFAIESQGLVFDHDAHESHDVLFDLEDAEDLHGTLVRMQISGSAERTAKQVFDAFSTGPDEYAFAKTIVPVRLARVGDENLISRSQAKRLLQRVEKFRCVLLDFDGVTSIGQAFADEIFRVFSNAHPEVELVAIHAVSEVQQMIRRAEVLRDEGRDPLPPH
jgi:anti-sigma regulatory factor (Ser/Thr protein kinase)